MHRKVSGCSTNWSDCPLCLAPVPKRCLNFKASRKHNFLGVLLQVVPLHACVTSSGVSASKLSCIFSMVCLWPVPVATGSIRRRSAAARLLRLWVRIPPWHGCLSVCLSVCCECCVLSGRGLCDRLITHPEEFYRVWCVVVCDLETSWMRKPWPTGGYCANRKKIKVHL